MRGPLRWLYLRASFRCTFGDMLSTVLSGRVLGTRPELADFIVEYAPVSRQMALTWTGRARDGALRTVASPEGRMVCRSCSERCQAK